MGEHSCKLPTPTGQHSCKLPIPMWEYSCKTKLFIKWKKEGSIVNIIIFFKSIIIADIVWTMCMRSAIESLQRCNFLCSRNIYVETMFDFIILMW